MDEFDTQIMSLIGPTDRLTCVQVAQMLSESYGVNYPIKRVRRRLDSLVTYDFLEKDKESRGRGNLTNIYSLPEGTIA